MSNDDEMMEYEDPAVVVPEGRVFTPALSLTAVDCLGSRHDST